MSKSIYLVAGLGQTGRSIAHYLKRRHLPFILYDTRASLDNLAEWKTAFPDTSLFLADLPSDIYPQIKEIIASPGVPLDSVVLKEARQKDIPIIGDIECFARAIQAPVIAITGTNGKSTVTSLVGEMAKADGLKVAVAGNIGLPVLDLLDNQVNYDLWVLELSSFQLELIFSLTPLAATILNISPDHLDRHTHFHAYSQAKQRVYNKAEILLYNRDDPQTYPQQENASLISFGLDKPSLNQWGIIKKENTYFLAKGEELFLDMNALRLKGKHNWQNALAACALAEVAKISPASIIKVLKSFEGLAHRCQWVRTINGVDWINDSKGTNIGATQSALFGIGSAMQGGKIVLIAGGIGKEADFRELRSVLNQFVRMVILIGVDASKIEQAIQGSVASVRAKDLEEAVQLAFSQAQPEDIVLLSPACASQDMFRDFNHRGEVFIKQVNRL